MALEEKTKGYEPERYKYAAAAAQFLQGKDMNSTRKCLDKLLVDLGATDEDIRAGMVWNAYEGDPRKTVEGIAIGVQIYSLKYQDALVKKTINEMFERYSPEFDKYLTPEEKEKAKSIFSKLGDKTYESVLEQVAQLQEVIDSKTKRYTDKDKEKAKKELAEKYFDVTATIQEFEELRITKLMPSIRESTIEDNVKARFTLEKAK